ncbi:hypothetical protein JTB14_024831 [Gonioctena quinquepunctata]|nr:hypothetical protein JTB14_024831 [Gonioctena quinquepunctata]
MNTQNVLSSHRGPSRPFPLVHGEKSRGVPQNRTSILGCWKCGELGHWQNECRNQQRLFCSRCGRNGIMFRHCPCENSLRNCPESDTARVQTLNIQEKKTQHLMYLHVPKEIIEPIPFESITRNERRDTTDFDTAKAAAHEGNRYREPRRRTNPGNRFRNHSISNLVLLKKEDVSVKADQPCMSSHMPGVITEAVPCGTVFKNRIPPHMKIEESRNFLLPN